MFKDLKRILVGNPIPTAHAIHERLSKRIALAVFSSDALSSTAYATEEILRVLAVAVAFGQIYAYQYVIGISIGIAVLLAIVAISYRQTIYAYPSGGGAYIVAKDNLGTMPGLVAAASLMVDYVLTVSVSVAAGIAAVTSAVQGTSFAWLSDHTVTLCLLVIMLIALANLRGVRESGLIFSIPTYAFIFSFLIMIVWGLAYFFLSGAPHVSEIREPAIAEGYKPGPLTIMLFLGAFSNGCTALTGIEAISNGVPAFKKPESRNAATTLVWMSITLIALFLGTSFLAHLYPVVPSEAETITSQIARSIFRGPFHWFFYFVQAATAAILVLAANTSFADFPRLASLLSRDRFLPRQFANQGDRLVFSNGIIVLAVLASALLIIFKGDTHRLIPLYAVGVFVSFTLSQTGMVIHWLRERDKSRIHSEAEGARLERTMNPEIDTGRLIEGFTEVSGWKTSIAINALGAVACLIVLIVFVITKFVHGAWIVVVLIPLIVVMFRSVRSHYESVADQLTIKLKRPLRVLKQTILVPISGVHNGVIPALEYARSLAQDPTDVQAVYIDIDPAATERMKKEWEPYAQFVPLVILDSPYRSLIQPLLHYIDEIAHQNKDALVTVVLPEFVPARWWHNFLHNQSAILIKAALLFRPGVVSVSVPYHLSR